MKKLILWAARLFWLLPLYLPMLARGQALQQLPPIHKISVKHVGHPAVSDAFVLANIRSKVGERLYMATIEEDETSLYATGFFYHVQVDQITTPDGVDLTYIVQGKPILTDIRIVGNKKLSLSKLRKKITSKTGQPFDSLKLFHDTEDMQQLYQKKGYPDTTVKMLPPSIDEAEGQASVTIEINETPKIKLVDVVFDNAKEFPQKKLRHVLKTRRHWMFSWLTGTGRLKKDEFEDDQETLRSFYQNEGYIDFEIKDIRYDHPTPRKLIIHIIVSEGRQYKVGKLNIKGNTLFTTNDFVKGVVIDRQLMKLTNVPGAIFKPAAFDADRETIQNMYGSKGYLSREQNGTTIVNASRNANTATSTMDVAFDIQEGEKCRIEKIEIKGNVKTKDKVIRRELAVFPGEVYDMVRVKVSKERLENMDYFTKVDTTAEDTDIPQSKNLVIGLEETSMSTATVGAGFSSVESIVGFAEVKMKNFDLFDPPTFTGAGQKLNLIVSAGSLYQDYELNFLEPYILGGADPLAFGVSLFHRQVDYDSLNSMYDETFDGGTLTLNKRLSQFVSGGVSYTLQSVHLAINSGFTTNSSTNYVLANNGLTSSPVVTPPNISTNIYDQHGSQLINQLGFNLGYDSRNYSKNTSRGEHVQFEADVATPPGDTDFYKMELKSSTYFEGFRPGHILELDARGGVVDSYGGTKNVPIYERWFLGGLYSLRGFRYRQTGPTDQFGEPLGGDTYFFAGAEYSIPLAKIVRLAWFYDMGNVFPDAYSFKLGSRQEHFFEDDAGIGLRIVLPMGGGMPLRLDYAIPITHDSDVGSGGRFQIGVGYTRDF